MNNRNHLRSSFLLLQINDSLFPIGGYSHSYGLETYIQEGMVRDLPSAEEYIKKRLGYNFLYTDLLSVRLAYEAAGKSDLEKLDRLEQTMEASRVPMELREASKKLGSRFIKTVMHMEVPWESHCFIKYAEKCSKNHASHSCAYGVFCYCAGIGKREAMVHFLYAQASAMVTNCVKTIPLSQSDGQRMLSGLSAYLEELLTLAGEAKEEMLCASTPGFDLKSIRHEQLYSRLYMS